MTAHKFQLFIQLKKNDDTVQINRIVQLLSNKNMIRPYIFYELTE